MFWTFPVAQPSSLCCNISPLYIEILLKSSIVHPTWLYWVFSNLSPQFHEKNNQESNVGSYFIISAYFVVMRWENVYFSHISFPLLRIATPFSLWPHTTGSVRLFFISWHFISRSQESFVKYFGQNHPTWPYQGTYLNHLLTRISLEMWWTFSTTLLFSRFGHFDFFFYFMMFTQFPACEWTFCFCWFFMIFSLNCNQQKRITRADRPSI